MTESRLIAIENLTRIANVTSKELLNLMRQLNACYSEKISLENHFKRERLYDKIDLKQAELNGILETLFLEMATFLSEETKNK